MANIDELSRYISDEMRRNVRSGEAKQIAVLRKQSFTHPVALAAWARLVDYGERWDHKDKILKRFGPWSTDLPTKHDYFLDVWSNIHYGYIGLSVGFDEGLLKLGAGVAQFKQDGLVETFGSQCRATAFELACFPALDHPHDQAAIQLGFDLWKAKGLQLTSMDVTSMVRSRRATLNTRRSKSS